MSDNGYMIRTDFLPEKGLVYVDLSGLIWVCPTYGIIPEEVKKVSLGRLQGFGRCFKKRGRVLTAPGVLEEIEQKVNSYDWQRGKAKGYARHRKRRKRAKDWGNRRRSTPAFDLSDSSHIRSWFKAYSSVYGTLERGSMEHGGRVSVSSDDVEKFVDARSRLSLPDKGLVKEALKAGNGVGILSADKLILATYRAGSYEFGLDGTFICDAIRGETVRARYW